MKIKDFALALESTDFQKDSPNLVSDFNFQVNYITDYIRKSLLRERFENDKFQLIMLRGRKKPSDIAILKEHFKSLMIEVRFDKGRYNQLYPYENDYPINDLLKPIVKIDEFSDFVIGMIMEGLEKGKVTKAPIPYDFLVNTILEFTAGGCKNEWIHKTRNFKEYDVKATLLCKLTANFFLLELKVAKENNVVFRKELLKTLPDPIFYKRYFKDLIIDDGKLIVTKDMFRNPPLFEVSLSEL